MGLIIALGFLTTLPVPRGAATAAGLARSPASFPLVGAIIGGLLVALDLLLAPFRVVGPRLAGAGRRADGAPRARALGAGLRDGGLPLRSRRGYGARLQGRGRLAGAADRHIECGAPGAGLLVALGRGAAA